MTKKGERPPVIIRVVAVALLVVTLYCAAEWIQMGRTLERGASVEDRLDEATSEMNAALREFRGDPEDARAVLTAIELNAAELELASAQVESIRSAVLPAGAQARSEYASALASRIEAQESYSADLSTAASKIIGREVIIKRLSDGFGVLDELSAPDLDTGKVRAVMDEVRAELAGALGDLHALEESGVGAYSSAPLVDRLTSLSDAVDATIVALDQQDAKALASATASFAALLKADWRALFFAADAPGIERLSEGVSMIAESQQAASAARGEITARREAMGLATLVCAAVGALLAAMAWLR